MLFWVLSAKQKYNQIIIIIIIKRQKYNDYNVLLKHNLLHYVLCFDILIFVMKDWLYYINCSKKNFYVKLFRSYLKLQYTVLCLPLVFIQIIKELICSNRFKQQKLICSNQFKFFSYFQNFLYMNSFLH